MSQKKRFLRKLLSVCTIRNVWIFKKCLIYIANVKFDDIYDVLEQSYLRISKNVLNFREFSLIL